MMRISALYFFLLCCALFVLMTCNVGEKDSIVKSKSLESDENVSILSAESRNFYETLPKQLQSRFLKRYKENDLNILYMFECAISNMKSDSEKFYPKFKGEDGKHHRNVPKEAYGILMQGVKEDFKIPNELENMIKDFGGEEAQFDVEPKYQAKLEMINYFYDICGYLSRYADEKVIPYLTAESYDNADALMDKIIKPGYNDADKKSAIIKFAIFYARIRHWSNRYAHDCIGIFHQRSIELAEKKGRKVALYEVLDYMEMLRPLRFSKDDVDGLNSIIEIVYNSKAKKYFHKSYKYSARHKETIEGLLPLVNVDQCPIKWAAKEIEVDENQKT